MLEPNRAIAVKPVNIHEVLEHVRQLVAVAVDDKQVTIERNYDPSLPPVMADRDRLVQAFLNLVQNAVQAAPDGGQVVLRTRIQRQFTIGTRLHRLVLRADVVDNGPGIAASLADSLFIPLVTGRPDGHGLGLPIAQSIVQRLGGLIGFTREAGGTVFTVWLPLAAEKNT
jgi:two-component system nitrogen regulation sensor histidine kinase GlnL